MRAPAALAFAVAAALLGAGPARAQTTDVQLCQSPDRAEAGIAACTRVIQSGRYRGNDLSTLYTLRGIARRRLQHYDQARQDYDEAIRLNPANSRAHHSRGSVNYMQGRFELVIADANVAVRLDGKYAIAYEQRGLAQHRLGRLDGAIADYDRTIALEPRRALARFARGVAWRQKGDAARGAADMAAARGFHANIDGVAATLGIR